MAKELYLYNPIYDFVAEGLISQIQENMGFPIDLRVCCFGGSVLSGYGICAKIKEHGNITMKVDGNADSMAVNLLLFPKKAECLDVSEFTLHQASWPDWYNPTQEEQSKLDKMNNDLKAIMLARFDTAKFKKITGFTIDQMFDPTNRINIVLNADQALELGLVQKINKLTPAEVAAFNNRIPLAIAEKTEVVPIKHKVMTLDEFKAQHLEIYRAAFEAGNTAGVAQERDRVGAWAVFTSIDPEAVSKGIKEGIAITATAMAEFTLKAASPERLAKITAESAKPLVPGGIPVIEATEEEKKKADFEAETKKHLNIK